LFIYSSLLLLATLQIIAQAFFPKFYHQEMTLHKLARELRDYRGLHLILREGIFGEVDSYTADAWHRRLDVMCHDVSENGGIHPPKDGKMCYVIFMGNMMIHKWMWGVFYQVLPGFPLNSQTNPDGQGWRRFPELVTHI